MFGTIRKHQTWLWVVISALTIISFVIFFSPYSKVHEEGPADYGTVNGKAVTRDDYIAAQREVQLRYFFMTGNFPDEEAQRRGFDAARESYQWIFLVSKQEELGIDVGSDVAARIGRDMLSNFQRQGIATPAAFDKQILQPRGLNLRDFERFVKHYIGLQQLISIAGSSGRLVTPQEARTLYIRENQQVSAQAIVFSASNYLSRVTVTPEVISQFYTNYLASYRIPDRIQVAYVKFAVSNFLAKAESELSRSNLNDAIEANLQRMGTNYFGGAKTADEARAKLRAEIIKGRALADARRAANEFARPMFEVEKPRIEDLQKAAKTNNLQVILSAPFDRENGPEDMETGSDFVKVAFSRTPEDPFGQPYVAMDGVYVYGLAKTIPSEVPPLDKIRARVEGDYRIVQAASHARQAGYIFQATLTNGLAQGKAFDELCKGAGVKPMDLPPFSLSSRSIPGDIEESVPVNQVKELAFTTEPGKASQFQPTRGGGVVIYVKAKLPVDEQKMKEELPAFVNYLRRTRTEEAFQAWFRKEGERGLRNTPIAREDAARAQQGKKS